MQERRIVGEAGVPLSVRVFDAPSDNAPGLLLHHGLASSQHIWDLMVPRLTRRFRVVTYDARGHGLSGKPNRAYGFAHVVADALAVTWATGLRRPVMVGHSWGAMVALELAARHPRAVAGSVLVDGGLGTMRSDMDWQTAKERLAPPRLAGMPVEEFRAMIRTFTAGAVDVTPEVEAMVMSVMRVRKDDTIAPYLSRANHLRILRAIWEQDPAALYPRLRTPTLAIAAFLRGDPVERDAKRAAAMRALDAAPRGSVAIDWMEGIHDLPLQEPGPLARRIRRFVDDVVG